MNMNDKIHDFGYGKNYSDTFNDSMINKLEIKKVSDLKHYLIELLESQLINVKVKNSIVKKSDFTEIKLVIKRIK